ncbi:hypothetical protein [Enterobacter asburiae]|uniref:hypothetical protein n=1 Tax=Enterobacter asburiae TaxID=61645 RepID=UPI001E43E67C|nr:hypothetical protein [Enterobacter asburiae]MCE2004061.1 hypothetical protein [Enterobacter asburiae]
MNAFKIIQHSGEAPLKANQEGTVHLVISGGTPPYTHVEISTSTKAALQSNSIKYEIRKHSSEAIITLTGVPREAMTISVVVEVTDSAGVLDNVSFPLKIHSDISDENIEINNNIPKARSGFSYSFNISKGNKGVLFYLDPVSEAALREVGITLSEQGVLSATAVQTGIRSDYEIGVVFTAKKNGQAVNITNNRYQFIILPEVILELDHNYVDGKDIDSIKDKHSSDIIFISNNELQNITASLEILDGKSHVVNTKRFKVAISGSNLTLIESKDPSDLKTIPVGKYTLNIIGEDKYRNTCKWPYRLNILDKELPTTMSIGTVRGTRLINELNPSKVYEIHTDEMVNIPININGGLRPFKKNSDINVYEGMRVSTVGGSIILSGTVTKSVDALYTKYQRKEVTISVTDRNSAATNTTINLLVNMPPVGKNISSDDAPEIGKGSQQSISFDLFSDIDPEQYVDYYKAYPSYIEIVDLPKFTDSKVQWTKDTPQNGSVSFTGKIDSKTVITIKSARQDIRNHGVVILTAPNTPDGHLSFRFNIKNKNGNSIIARSVSIPIQDAMPVASLSLQHKVKVNQNVEINPLENSAGGPFDAVAISGESLSNIKGELKVTQNGNEYRLSVTVNDHLGGTEDIVFYLIKGYRASKGKVTLNITK